MPTTILKDVATQFPQVLQALTDAQDLITALKEAGEDTTELERQYAELKRKASKWELMLKNRKLI